MPHLEPPPEDHDKVEENGAAKPPMERFRGLTKGLLKVPRKELAEEQRRYESERAKKAH
jgi:hypothetical protein